MRGTPQWDTTTSSGGALSAQRSGGSSPAFLLPPARAVAPRDLSNKKVCLPRKCKTREISQIKKCACRTNVNEREINLLLGLDGPTRRSQRIQDDCSCNYLQTDCYIRTAPPVIGVASDKSVWYTCTSRAAQATHSGVRSSVRKGVRKWQRKSARSQMVAASAAARKLIWKMGCSWRQQEKATE